MAGCARLAAIYKRDRSRPKLNKENIGLSARGTPMKMTSRMSTVSKYNNPRATRIAGPDSAAGRVCPLLLYFSSARCISSGFCLRILFISFALFIRCLSLLNNGYPPLPCCFTLYIMPDFPPSCLLLRQFPLPLQSLTHTQNIPRLIQRVHAPAGPLGADIRWARLVAGEKGSERAPSLRIGA